MRAILEPVLAGENLGHVPADDRQLVVDPGLLRRRPEGGLQVTSPMFRELIERALSSAADS